MVVSVGVLALASGTCFTLTARIWNRHEIDMIMTLSKQLQGN